MKDKMMPTCSIFDVNKLEKITQDLISTKGLVPSILLAIGCGTVGGLKLGEVASRSVSISDSPAWLSAVFMVAAVGSAWRADDALKSLKEIDMFRKGLQYLLSSEQGQCTNHKEDIQLRLHDLETANNALVARSACDPLFGCVFLMHMSIPEIAAAIEGRVMSTEAELFILQHQLSIAGHETRNRTRDDFSIAQPPEDAALKYV